MEEKIKLFLDRIHFDKDDYKFFDDSKLTKIKITKDKKTWNIFISKKNNLPVEIIKKVDDKKHNLYKDAKIINIHYDVEDNNLEILHSYYSYIRTITRHFKNY